MNEETPVFKVTDRRLFNADGSPREVEETPKPEAPPAKSTATPPVHEAQSIIDSSSKAESGASDSAERPSDDNADRESESSTNEADAATSDDEAYVQGDIPGADDPASFINFLMSIASNAAAALGMMEHPVTGQRSLDPELGKHWIDVLGMLEKKTKGNLSPKEHQIFEGLLADLRMQYVSLSSAPQSKASRFSGSDIVGGK